MRVEYNPWQDDSPNRTGKETANTCDYASGNHAYAKSGKSPVVMTKGLPPLNFCAQTIFRSTLFFNIQALFVSCICNLYKHFNINPLSCFIRIRSTDGRYSSGSVAECALEVCLCSYSEVVVIYKNGMNFDLLRTRRQAQRLDKWVPLWSLLTLRELNW